MIIWVSTRLDEFLGHQCQQRLTAAESHCLGAAWRTCTVAVVHPGDGNSNKKQGNFHGENDEPLDWTGLWVADFQSHIGNQLAKYLVH